MLRTRRVSFALLLVSIGCAIAAASPDAPRLSTKRFVVILDPGHGGDDMGTLGCGVVAEKVVALAIAEETARTLREVNGIEVLLTRTGDEFVSLSERIAIARRAGGDLFVSIHANSAPNSRAKGAEVFFLSPRGASDQLAEELADRENAALLVPQGSAHREDDDLLSILVDLQGSGIQQLSSAFAERVLAELGQEAASARAVRQANFVVLRSLSMPSILIEVGFLSNAAEARRLASRQGRMAIADAIADAVISYVEQHGELAPSVSDPSAKPTAPAGRHELGQH